jgi:hypothetical protein
MARSSSDTRRRAHTGLRNFADGSVKPAARANARRRAPDPRAGPVPYQPPWMKIDEPASRSLKVYALDPSAGNYVGNVMSVQIRWERNLKPGPVSRRFAVVDYDGANKVYYPPLDLNDYRILARGGLDPSESEPRFHQQMVYAVACETLEKFEAALGRTIHWRRADRPGGNVKGDTKAARKADDIWVLKLYPHAMLQANAFYSREAHGILFGYFRATDVNQGNNLPGQRIFTCLSHDIIAHEVTHAVIDGIRTFFTEPTNPDVLAFHEAFADMTALFLHFSHKEALLDTIRKTGGRLYQFELKPDAAPLDDATPAKGDQDTIPRITGETGARNPLVELAQQFGEASGMGRGLRAALDMRPDPNALRVRVHDPHFRGSILVAAVFDAYFSTYLRASADLFRIYRAGGGRVEGAELPASLANLLAETASRTADEFFQLCARSLDYCPPVDITFGDFLRALITVSADLKPDDDLGIRQELMQAFRVRGIYPDSASFFSEGALRWPRVPDWTRSPVADALPPVAATIVNEATKRPEKRELIFGSASGLTKEEKDLNGEILRRYAWENAARLGFNADPALPANLQPYAPSFHQVFRVYDGQLRIDMVVELVQTRRVPFDKAFPEAGSFPLRGGVTLIVAAPDRDATGHRVPPKVRFAIGKRLIGKEGVDREASQRTYSMAIGLMNGNTNDERHFQANFGLVHQGT